MLFAKKVVVALAATLLLVGQVVAAPPVKYNTAGYWAYAYAYFESCSVDQGSYLDLSLWSYDSSTKVTGNNKLTDKYESLGVYFNFVTSCDGDTVNFLTGSAYEWSYNDVKPTFSLETQKMANALIKNVQVPVLSYSCAWSCYEVCYAEIFGYGTCPPWDVYTECSPSCSYPEPAGTAIIDVTWSDPSNTPLSVSTNSYRSKFYHYKAKGSSRYAPVTISAKVDGVSILPGTPSYAEGYLSSSSDMTIYKY